MFDLVVVKVRVYSASFCPKKRLSVSHTVPIQIILESLAFDLVALSLRLLDAENQSRESSACEIDERSHQ